MSRRRLGVGAAIVGDALVPGDVVVDDAAVATIGVAPVGPGGRGRGRRVRRPAGQRLRRRRLHHGRRGGLGRGAGRVGPHGGHLVGPDDADRQAGSLRPGPGRRGGSPRRRPPGARVLGVHLEGPFLSAVRRGAHREDWLRPPDPALVDEWLAAAPIAMVTLAPELPGALDVVRRLRARGVVVSLGHTDALGAIAHEAFDAGASMVTHLWNAQRQPTSRQPAVGGVGMARADVHVGVICDLVHVDADTLRFTHAATGRRFVAVTDACPSPGCPTVSTRCTAAR